MQSYPKVLQTIEAIKFYCNITRFLSDEREAKYYEDRIFLSLRLTFYILSHNISFHTNSGSVSICSVYTTLSVIQLAFSAPSVKNAVPIILRHQFLPDLRLLLSR